jgi:hypothetical protein
MFLNFNRKKNQKKVFCIGLNKTGTTSLAAAFERHGLSVGNQTTGEELTDDWSRRDFKQIIKLCYTADAFQDAPFSFPFTYQALDMHFSNAKYILTVRDSFEQWYSSLTRFHSKKWADANRLPTAEDLRNADYCGKGWAYRLNRVLFNSPEDDLYEVEALRCYYESHNNAVVEYFRHRPESLLTINLSEPSAYIKFCSFMGLEPAGENFPWLNKTDDQ